MTDEQLQIYAYNLHLLFTQTSKSVAFSDFINMCDDQESYGVLTDLVADVCYHCVRHLAENTNLVLPQVDTPCNDLPTA